MQTKRSICNTRLVIWFLRTRVLIEKLTIAVVLNLYYGELFFERVANIAVDLFVLVAFFAATDAVFFVAYYDNFKLLLLFATGVLIEITSFLNLLVFGYHRVDYDKSDYWAFCIINKLWMSAFISHMAFKYYFEIMMSRAKLGCASRSEHNVIRNFQILRSARDTVLPNGATG